MWREKLKHIPVEYEHYKVNERHRKVKTSLDSTNSTIPNPASEMASPETPSPLNISSSSSSNNSPQSSFSNRQSLNRSLSRVDNHLPKSPHKKAEVIEKLRGKISQKRRMPYTFLNGPLSIRSPEK